MSRVPRGVPSVTYCRILNPSGGFSGKGDVISDGNSITVLEAGQPSSRHEVGQVLPPGISDEDVCEMTFGNQAGAGMGASLNPITACICDAVTAIIFVVGSKETRKWHFLKKTVLPFVANELFSNIAERDQQFSSSQYKAQINLSAFEIQDEIITDLLRPVNRGLSLAVTAEDGVIVQGLQSEAIMDEMDLRRLLLDACDNRASHTLPPGGSIDTTSAIFEFTVYQSEGGSVGIGGTGEARECHSRLLVVEVPSTDPLVVGGAVDVRQLEGPTLHKSLLTFLDVTKKLNTPSRAAIAPYRSSKLTHFLCELLGGNAIVVGLGVLAHGEPQVTRRTLEIVGALSTALHYPIGGRELTDVLQGLLGKYRSMLMQLQDELLSRVSHHQGSMQTEMQLEKSLIQIQYDHAEALKEKNIAIEDRERVYEVAELIKTKYQTLMNEKLQQTEELAQNKEDNVVLARSLMNQKLELTDFKEKSEKEIFDLAGQLMNARNHIENLNNTILEEQKQIDEYKEQINEKLNDINVLKQEIQDLNIQITEKNECIQIEKDKNIDLGAELLTLVNRKDHLQKEYDNLIHTHDNTIVELNEKQALENSLKTELQEADKLLKQKEEQMFELTKHSTAIELEAKQAKLEADQLALQCREKLLQLTPAGGRPSSTAATEVGISGTKYEELQTSIRKGGKVIKELERNLRRVQADLEETRKEKLLLSSDLTEVREKYRNKLESLLVHDGDNAYHRHHAKVVHRQNSRKQARHQDEGSGTKSRNNNNAEDQQQEVEGDPLPSGELTAAAQLQHQLLDSYSEREASLNETLERSIQQSVSIKLAYRELYDKYRTTVDLIEEQLPKSSAGKLKTLEEQLKFAEIDLTQSEAYLDEVEARERTALREKFEAEQAAGMLKNERMSHILATYQRNLEVTERKLVAGQQENIDLHIQIKQLIQNSSKLQSQIKELSVSGKNINQESNGSRAISPTIKPLKDANMQLQEDQQKQYTAMYAALTEQIKELKEQMRGTALSPVPSSGAVPTSVPVQAVPEESLDNIGAEPEGSKPSSKEGSRRLVEGEDGPTVGALSKQSSGKQGHLSRALTPAAVVSTTPPRRPSAVPVTTPESSSLTKPSVSVSSKTRPPTPAEDLSNVPNPHAFKTMAECLQHISALEANSHQALSLQLQKAQQRSTDLTLRNAALEEELKSYQAYMRDVVPQYKKQLQYMKAQLKVKSTAEAIQAAPAAALAGDKDLKLPLIK